MQIKTFEDYLQEATWSEQERAERASIQAEFPWFVVVEGDVPEFDLAVQWCWTRFGPLHGECWRGAPNPACLVDSTAVHSHFGTWTVTFFGKTSYDHGFGEFCFASEVQQRQFAEYVPQV